MALFFISNKSGKVFIMSCTGCAKRRKWLESKYNELERRTKLLLLKVTRSDGRVGKAEQHIDSKGRK